MRLIKNIILDKMCVYKTSLRICTRFTYSVPSLNLYKQNLYTCNCEDLTFDQNCFNLSEIGQNRTFHILNLDNVAKHKILTILKVKS